jgi:hypothetical protein
LDVIKDNEVFVVISCSQCLLRFAFQTIRYASIIDAEPYFNLLQRKIYLFLIVINILRYVSSVNQFFLIQFNNSLVIMYFVVNLMLL